MKMNKKLIVVVGTAVLAIGAFAGPRGPHRGPGGFHHGPRPGGFHHGPRPGGFHHGPRPGGFHRGPHHYHSWGRGGRHFWPGFAGGVIGGVVGGVIYDSLRPTTYVTTPTIVTTPTVVTTTPLVTAPAATVQNVWVEGRYVDQVQANGTVIRVWQPGHYEQREVLLQ